MGKIFPRSRIDFSSIKSFTGKGNKITLAVYLTEPEWASLPLGTWPSKEWLKSDLVSKAEEEDASVKVTNNIGHSGWHKYDLELQRFCTFKLQGKEGPERKENHLEELAQQLEILVMLWCSVQTKILVFSLSLIDFNTY